MWIRLFGRVNDQNFSNNWHRSARLAGKCREAEMTADLLKWPPTDETVPLKYPAEIAVGLGVT